MQDQTVFGFRAGRVAQQLPEAVRISVRDTVANRVLAASTVARIRVTAPGAPQASGASERGRGSSSVRTGEAAMRVRATSAPDSARPAAEAGFVLVAVLWILAALATLASIYSSYTINTAAASHVADDRVQAEASIRAGVEMAVFRQLAAPEKARPARGGFDIRVGRTGVSVRFRSEGARIDLNAAPADLLTGLFTAVGVEFVASGNFRGAHRGMAHEIRAGRGRERGGR